MPAKFHILGSELARPASAATIFCDGSADDSFRPGVDVELSHWIPNRTPIEVRADTSTEICLKFVALGEHEGYDLVVNNHVDVDGVLSVFALVEPRLALAHRTALVGAAEMGDFWAYGGGVALSIFAKLTEIAGREGTDPNEVYAQCFAAIRELLGGATLPAHLDEARAVLAEAIDLVAKGRIVRDEIHHRFVSYVVPRELAERDLDAALHVPEFGAPITRAALLPPQARNFQDAQRIQLVSVETADGWYHDLWYPGYVWADTEYAWRPPGLQVTSSTNAWLYGFGEMAEAVDALRTRETAPGGWATARHLQPFKTIPGRNFPVVLSFVGKDEQPAPSALSPADVTAVLAPAFAGC